MPDSAQYMYGVPTPPYSPLATSISQAFTQHYHSFIAFQQHAMVMSQMLAGLNCRRSQSPDSSVQLVSSSLPRHFTFSPTEDHRLQLPSAFPELEEYSPLSLKAQSDQGYCSSVTSESRSKSSRLSGGSETSGKSRNWLISPEIMRTKSSRPPSSFDENSQSSYDSASVQAPEISSSVDIPSTLLDEDSRRSMSKYLPSFCDESSNQSLPGVEIKIEPLSPRSSPRTSEHSDTPKIEIDYATNIKEEIDAPVSFLNSDVMWSVSPGKYRQQPKRFVPSPDKSSNDCSMDLSGYQSYFSKSRRLSSPVQGTVPFISPFTPCEAKLSSKSQTSNHSSSSVDLQTEAIDLSVPKKRKAKAQMKENVKKRLKKESKKKSTFHEEEVDESCFDEDQENIDAKQGKFVLQISKLLNLNDANKKTIRPPKGNQEIGKSPHTSSSSIKPSVIKPPSIKPTRSKPTSIIPPPRIETSSSKPISIKPANRKPTSIKTSNSKPTTEKKRAPVQRNDVKDKKFQCKVCEKNYSQRSSLHTHMRIHTGVRPYECKDCGRSFTDCSTYIKHCRLHTGEKPYACSVCGRCFTQSGNMMRHQEKCKTKTLNV